MKSQARTCILVAGMHRSGTSAMTRVVNLLGADIAGDLVDGIPGDNDRGFWESHATYRLHDRLFAAFDSAWHDPYPLPDGWQEADAAREAKRAIRDHIDREFAISRMFVVKDPRMTRVLPLWLEALDELAIAPVIVIPFRNPLEVAASLERRDGLPPARSLLAYIQCNLEVERASRGRRRMFQPYDDLISDWRSFAEKLACSGGPDAKALSPAIAGEIDSFLSADLKRHQVTRASLASLPTGAAMLAEIYDRMVQAAATGNETSLRACFDRVREGFGEMAKLFRTVASAQAKDHRDEITRLKAKAGAEIERRAAETNELRAQVNALEARAEDAARAQAAADQEISSMQRSTSWRVTAPLRVIGRLVKAAGARRATLKHSDVRSS
jgi:hypothetical protein